MTRKRWYLIFTVGFSIASAWIAYVSKSDPSPSESLKISGKSMAPLIPSGTRVPHDPNFFKSHAPKNGDIVTFRLSPTSKLMVKTVIAVPGDQLKLRDSWLYVNGVTAKNSKNVEYEFRSPAFAAMLEMTPIVPEGSVLLMGESRKGTFDSSRLGFVPVSDLIGRVYLEAND